MRIFHQQKIAALAATLVALAAVVAVFAYVSGTLQSEQSNDVSLRLSEGIALYHEAKYAEALAALEQIPDGATDDWRLPYYTASAHTMLKQYEPAAAYMERALALNNAEPKILYALGVLYYKLGNLKLAKAYFASTLEIEPGNEHAKGLMDIMAMLERNAATNAENLEQ